MSMEYIEINDVYQIHEEILKVSKGKVGVRDFALLHSAIERPKATFSGEDLYPTVFIKAAALLQSLCLNHAFYDANKRTAWGTTKWFLSLNGYNLATNIKEAADFMVHVDKDKPEFKEIVDWIKKHAREIT